MQKSFVNYVGFEVIGRVSNPAISSAPTSNKRLSLPTAGFVSTAVSSKTGFADGPFLCFMDFKAFFPSWVFGSQFFGLLTLFFFLFLFSSLWEPSSFISLALFPMKLTQCVISLGLEL